jgi:hypothetical protein
MTAAALDATTRVRSLIAITEELTAIFDRENAALNARRPREIAPLQADKARLAAAYAQSIRDIAADRRVVAGAGSILIEKLRELTKTFEQRADEQRALLEAARRAAAGVVKAVADEAAAAATPAYSNRASAEPQAVPVAFSAKA